jgi:hypothetical protein
MTGPPSPAAGEPMSIAPARPESCPDCGAGLDHALACPPCDYRLCAGCGHPTGSWQLPRYDVCASQCGIP